MQATLSSTASGKHFRTGTRTALIPSPSAFERDHRNDPPFSYPHSVADGPGLAHDARNLLGALGLYCDLLARPGVLREEHRHYADELRILSERSRGLIDQFFHSSSAPSQQAPEPSVSVLPEVIARLRGLLEAIGRCPVAVTCEAGSMAPVSIEPETLERILINLAKNAAEASALQDTIHLRVCSWRACPADEFFPAGDRIVLTVEDQGRGMSDAMVQALLSGTGPAVTGPRGIGFPVVRELVARSGGRLRLESRPGQGTTVEIVWAIATPRPAALNPLEERRQLMAAMRRPKARRAAC